jgi:hypothetical protein
MFFQAGLRRRNEEATGLETVGEIRSRLTIALQFNSARSAEAEAAAGFLACWLPQQLFLQCNTAGHFYFVRLCWLATGDGGQRASTRRKAMEGKGDGYLMEFLGEDQIKKSRGRGREKEPGRQREHRSMRR